MKWYDNIIGDKDTISFSSGAYSATFRDAGRSEPINVLIFLLCKNERYSSPLNSALDTISPGTSSCGWTDADLDFKNRIITVSHQLLQVPDVGY